ncbi:hypothetical protein O181_105494 [Austropuccinia psidii MF-1]|uniref:Uncharacterized protein n=1 Tax=Austropuccinia psidii MF-1 TaxID=1389203 RepID=A0A9Q3JQ97_9BASI|nr:hypothetical protein [Austropuccinia psidii MF-1]
MESNPLSQAQSFDQLSANLDRGPPIEGEAPSRRGGPICILGEADDEEGEESVKEEVPEDTEVEGVPEAPETPTLALSKKTLVSQAELSILKMMEKMS